MGCDAVGVGRYLAEDRVLCFELLAKEKKHDGYGWTLHFVAGSVADTGAHVAPQRPHVSLMTGRRADVPATLLELIKQRRRWLNGSFFALVYYVKRFKQLLGPHHSICRRFWLTVQFVYQASARRGVMTHSRESVSLELSTATGRALLRPLS